MREVKNKIEAPVPELTTIERCTPLSSSYRLLGQMACYSPIFFSHIFIVRPLGLCHLTAEAILVLGFFPYLY